MGVDVGRLKEGRGEGRFDLIWVVDISCGWRFDATRRQMPSTQCIDLGHTASRVGMLVYHSMVEQCNWKEHDTSWARLHPYNATTLSKMPPSK